MASYTTGANPALGNAAAALSILTAALSTFSTTDVSGLPTSLALSSLSAPHVSRTSQPPNASEIRPTTTRATALPSSYNDQHSDTSTGTMSAPTAAAAPMPSAFNGGVIPSLATIGTVIVLTGDGYTITAAVPTANTDALAIGGGPTITVGGEAATMSDATYSLASSGALQIIANESTATVVQSTYGSGQTLLSVTTSTSQSIPTVVTMTATQSSETSSGSITMDTASPPTMSATPTTSTSTSTQGSAGQRNHVMWSVGVIALFGAVAWAL